MLLSRQARVPHPRSLLRARAIIHRNTATTAAASSDAMKPISQLPAPRFYPFLGHFPDFFWRQVKFNGCTNKAFHSMYEDFGPIFRFEIPQLASFVVVSDPLDMVSVLQNEGKYPFGSVTQMWPLKKYVDENMSESSLQRAFFTIGEDWRVARSILAPAISPPKAARSFIPALAHASRLASRSAGSWAEQFDLYLNHAAFDLFTGLSIGSFPNTCARGESGQRYEEFVNVTLRLFHATGVLYMDPFGQFKPWKFRELSRYFDRSIELADEITAETIEVLQKGEGTKFQKDSFLHKLMEAGNETRAIQEGVRVVLQAGVDTTGYVMSWLMLNMAQHQEYQQKLREELKEVLGGEDVTEETIQQLPFLKACIRESHRLTPPSPLSVMKEPLTQLNICGYEIPPNTTVALNGVGLSWDPEYVDAPQEFRPERFLPEAVEARKGTKSELLDHRLLSNPFSGGARMCLGARVAQLEILAFAARFFQDWEIELQPGQKWNTKTFLLLKAHPYPRFNLTWLH